VRYANSSVGRVLGYGQEEFIGTKMSLYLDPEESESVLCVLGAKLGEPASVPTVAEFKVRHVDGSWRHLEATGVSLLDDPQVEGIALCLRDVTERKALEKDLARRALCDPMLARRG
jgi:PAS domain S-box-containing protein